MSDLNPHLAPLSADKITEMAVKFYGNSINTRTVTDATAFAQRVLQEAERLFEVWKSQQLCSLKGHEFAIKDTMVGDLYREDGDILILTEYKAESIRCRNCDTKLIQQKTLV